MTDLNVILAEQQGLGRIHLCGCNAVHVSTGPVTVVLSFDAFLQAAALVDIAKHQLAAIAAETTLTNTTLALQDSTPKSLLTH